MLPNSFSAISANKMLALDAIALPSRGFGDMFEIAGVLRGPNGAKLQIRTIWMREQATDLVKFITLIPVRRERR